jgi:serine/threonine protein kinase
MTIVGTNEWYVGSPPPPLFGFWAHRTMALTSRMAPEVAMGESYDKSADVFSFGMVAYELITRDKPPMRKLKDCYAFNGSEHKGTYLIPPPQLVLSGWFCVIEWSKNFFTNSASSSGNIPSDTPPALWDLLLLCAARDPQDRPDFKKVVDSLKAILESLPAKSARKESSKKKATSDKTENSGEKKSKKKTTDKEGEGEKKKKKKKTTTKESEGEKKEEGEKKKKSTKEPEAEKKEEVEKKKKKKTVKKESDEGEKKKKKRSTKKEEENGDKKKKKSTKKAE